jgi:hypothetical protein
MPLANFSKIVIIQSLRTNDGFTGTKLHEDLEIINIFLDLGLEIELINVHKNHELFEALRKIEYQTRKDGLYPLLHLEIHGNNDTTGLILSSGDCISWTDLIDPLTKINVACRLNLIVVLAVCYGAHLMQIIQPSKRAPFWGIIGPTEEIKVGFILKSFYAFYRTLLETGNGSDAINALSKSSEKNKLTSFYYFTNAELYFKKTYLLYNQECTPDGLQHRAKGLYRRLKKEQGNSTKSVGQIKRHLKIKQEEIFYMHANRFFMHDLYDENKIRFNLEYNEVVNTK